MEKEEYQVKSEVIEKALSKVIMSIRRLYATIERADESTPESERAAVFANVAMEHLSLLGFTIPDEGIRKYMSVVDGVRHVSSSMDDLRLYLCSPMSGDYEKQKGKECLFLLRAFVSTSMAHLRWLLAPKGRSGDFHSSPWIYGISTSPAEIEAWEKEILEALTPDALRKRLRDAKIALPS